MPYPNSGSFISAERTATSTSLSTQIIVKVQDYAIGAIQELTVNQNKNLKRYQEIGTDGVIEIVPVGAATVTVSVRRIVFDGLSLTESFARAFTNIQAQRIPFDIDIFDFQQKVDVLSVGGGVGIPINSLPKVRRIHNCWFARLTTPYNANDFIISENAEIWAEYITNFNPLPRALGRQLWPQGAAVDTIEREIDTSGRRGSLNDTSLEQRKEKYSISDLGRKLSDLKF